MLVFEWNFLGLSTEVMPSTGDKVIDGSTYYECDTGDFYIYYKDRWYKQTFVTEDGINVFLYKYLTHRMFGKAFDTNIMKANVINPEVSSSISFVTDLPSSITSFEMEGNSLQNTYTGKNLLPIDTNSRESNGITATTNATDGTVILDGTSTATAAATMYNTLTIAIVNGETYTLSANNPIANSGVTLRLYAGGSSYPYELTLSEANASYSFTAEADYTCRAQWRVQGSGVELDEFSFKPMLEHAGTASSFEPYVGGSYSPSPDYPQPINVVSGDQTITINDTSSFIVALGEAELCKIDNYQDYIYKSNNDWYIHKEINKLVVDGSETGWASSAVTGGRQFYLSLQDANTTSPRKIMCDKFYYITGSTAENITYLNSSGLWVIYKPSSNGEAIATSTDEFKTWLSTHNTTVYYALAEPSEAKITDTTVINALNSLLDYEFPAGENQIVVTAETLAALLKLTIIEKE